VELGVTRFCASVFGYVQCFLCTIKAFGRCPITPQDDWEQHYVIPLSGSNSQISLCNSFFSVTLSMYLVSEGYPTLQIHIFLRPSVRVEIHVSPFCFRFLSPFIFIMCDLHYHAVEEESRPGVCSQTSPLPSPAKSNCSAVLERLGFATTFLKYNQRDSPSPPIPPAAAAKKL
jgi:hypothetical protein